METKKQNLLNDLGTIFTVIAIIASVLIFTGLF